MTNLEALKLVLELAEQNILSEGEANAAELEDELEEQEEACQLVRALIDGMQT